MPAEETNKTIFTKKNILTIYNYFAGKIINITSHGREPGFK